MNRKEAGNKGDFFFLANAWHHFSHVTLSQNNSKRYAQFKLAGICNGAPGELTAQLK